MELPYTRGGVQEINTGHKEDKDFVFVFVFCCLGVGNF